MLLWSMYLLGAEVHLAGEQASCMLVHSLDMGIDKGYNHSSADNIADNTVDTPAFVVDWLSQHCCYLCCCLVMILLVIWLDFVN